MSSGGSSGGGSGSTGAAPNSTFEAGFSPPSASATPQQHREKMGKIATRRESGRQIKKVNKDLPDAQVESPQVVLNATFCIPVLIAPLHPGCEFCFTTFYCTVLFLPQVVLPTGIGHVSDEILVDFL